MITPKQTIQNINRTLANGGKEKVIEENRHKLTAGDLSGKGPRQSQAQKNKAKLDALRAKINGK